jgi:hypothetical protein
MTRGLNFENSEILASKYGSLSLRRNLPDILFRYLYVNQPWTHQTTSSLIPKLVALACSKLNLWSLLVGLSDISEWTGKLQNITLYAVSVEFPQRGCVILNQEIQYDTFTLSQTFAATIAWAPAILRNLPAHSPSRAFGHTTIPRYQPYFF